MSDRPRCPVCIEHPGWAHPEETGKRSDPADVCRACLGSGVELRQENSVRATYVVGVPLAMEIHHDGRVTFHVDLSEIDDDAEPCDGTTFDEHDLLILSAAAGRVSNTHQFSA